MTASWRCDSQSYPYFGPAPRQSQSGFWVGRGRFSWSVRRPARSRIVGRASRGCIMNARLERKLRMFAVIIVAGAIAGFAIGFAQGRTSPASMAIGVVYGLLISATIGGVELFVL